MLRAIFRRRMRDVVSGCQIDNQLFSIRVDVPAIENELRRGGFGESGFESVELVGVEIEKPEDNPHQCECGAVAELIAAAKDIRDNPGTDLHGSVGFCAIELPKLDRLRDALAALDASR